MAAYTYLTEQEFITFSKVSDKEINEALQEVREVMPQWFIQEHRREKIKIFSKNELYYTYSVYYKELPNYGQVRWQVSAQTKQSVLNLLYGLFMGYNHKNKTECNLKH